MDAAHRRNGVVPLPEFDEPVERAADGCHAGVEAAHVVTTSRYPMPRTVCMNSGLAGSCSILRRSRLTCTSTARSLMVPPLSASAKRVTVSPGVAARMRSISRSRPARRMRRSSSTTSRCDASSASVAGSIIGRASTPRFRRAVGTRDQAQHALAIIEVDHGGQKMPCRVVRPGSKFGNGAIDARGLQAGELERQRLALRRHVEQPLSAILRAFLLHHIALIDHLLEHAAERLLSDVEDVEQVGDLHAGIAVDEMPVSYTHL